MENTEKERIPLPLLLLIISVFFAAAGFLLLYSAYHKKAAITCAVNQLEFTGTLPTIITRGDKLKAPILQDDTMFKPYGVKGYLTCDFYEDYVSLRYVSINLKSRMSSARLSEIIDARARR